MSNRAASGERQALIRTLFAQYIEWYAARDERLMTLFSENVTILSGSTERLLASREEAVAIARLDFAQVKDCIGIDLLDLTLQDLVEEVVMATALLRIRLPLPDTILASKTARLVLVFRHESEGWKIVHSSLSLAYIPAQEGEVYPLQNLRDHRHELEVLVETRTLELEAANRQLERLSHTDGLTGIANRRYFDQVLQTEWNRAWRSDSWLGLVMLDVDHFKSYNDRYGHLAGDRCLQRLATALATAARRAGDTAARYGGEEFTILLPGADLGQAVEVAQKVQREIWTLALPHEDSEVGIVTVSLGVASLVPTQWLTPTKLVGQADVALYRAKQWGRNQIQTAKLEVGAAD